MNVSAWCIRNPIPSVLFFVMLTLAGLLGFQQMKIQNFPDIDLPTITVSASLPGASPAQMETEVARKIENAVATLTGIKNIYTNVRDGSATVTVEFRLEKPTQEALDDVRDAVARTRSDLPADLRDPVVSKVNLAGTPILTYTVASTRMDEEALSWFVDNEATRALLAVRGVGSMSRASCDRCSRRLRAGASTSVARSRPCARSPPCNRPRSWGAWRSHLPTAVASAWRRSRRWRTPSPSRAARRC